MDDPRADLAALQDSSKFLGRLNRLTGLTGASLPYLEHFSRHWKRGQTIRVLDLASVAQAFTHDEIIALRNRAGLSYAAYHPLFRHQFVLAGEKPSARINDAK